MKQKYRVEINHIINTLITYIYEYIYTYKNNYIIISKISTNAHGLIPDSHDSHDKNDSPAHITDLGLGLLLSPRNHLLRSLRRGVA